MAGRFRQPDGATLGAVAAMVLAAALAAGAQSGSARTTADGIYTVDQARRSRDLYRKRCVLCHLERGQGQQARPVIPGESLEREGDAEAPPIAGEAFLKTWNGRTVGALFEQLSKTMPPGGVGSLTPQAYGDVLAYLLELNKLPAGTEELSAVPDELARITIFR